MNMENFCKGGGDGFRRFNGFYGFNGVGAAHNTMEAPFQVPSPQSLVTSSFQIRDPKAQRLP